MWILYYASMKFKQVVFTDKDKKYVFEDITLSDALDKMKEQGIDVVANHKMMIAAFYH